VKNGLVGRLRENDLPVLETEGVFARVSLRQ
jgi:hypothetical protein